MSFSSNVKAELCKDSLSKKSCAVAEGYGVLLYCNTFSSTEIRIITESRDFAARLPRLFKKAFGITFDQEPAAHDRGKLQFAISSEDKISRIFETLQMDLKASLTLHVNFGMLEEEAECMAYLRGAFLAGGSVTDPAKRYHLEMTTSHYKVSRETCALLIECGFSPKELSRGGNNILYFKQSDYIEDFLTAIGAQVSAMGVMEAKVEKDLRNGVNRRVNCETANLTKVVDASMGQMAAIRALEEAGELDKLPGKLRETALLRRENPEATLQELAAMLNPPITKSAINHRMRKLLELARALEE
ncbi:MAG: DNA-binding protein WhiA [Oscillospiraceae bacterium]|nr:DNA-binding protein WhiA [Clostridiales bacterium]MDD7486583.1 DNA-binding protein WhiA [Clostridiales bacterium]MDY2690346.1 DNA-binding protein WhiA [Oscillospiraceae bacterium]